MSDLNLVEKKINEISSTLDLIDLNRDKNQLLVSTEVGNGFNECVEFGTSASIKICKRSGLTVAIFRHLSFDNEITNIGFIMNRKQVPLNENQPTQNKKKNMTVTTVLTDQLNIVHQEKDHLIEVHQQQIEVHQQQIIALNTSHQQQLNNLHRHYQNELNASHKQNFQQLKIIADMIKAQQEKNLLDVQEEQHVNAENAGLLDFRGEQLVHAGNDALMDVGDEDQVLLENELLDVLGEAQVLIENDKELSDIIGKCSTLK